MTPSNELIHTKVASLLQPDDIAHELGVSVQTVRNWVNNGHLQCLPGTRTKYVTREALDRFLSMEGAV